MSDPLFDAEDEAATPLDPDEREGLIPSYVTLRRELNEAEAMNIAEAERWAFSRKRDVLSEGGIRTLHKHMFGKVWKWAGEFRKTERNIGIDPIRIGVELKTLLDDVIFWIDNEIYPPDEIAVRFHHRLVAIHPFPNGNGRHARLAADILIKQLGGDRFTWGRTSMVNPGDTRKTYIAALQKADRHDISDLIAFARS
ncbi:MAG: mobile mystery protein B [Parasphingorhabdus sp.]